MRKRELGDQLSSVIVGEMPSSFMLAVDYTCVFYRVEDALGLSLLDVSNYFSFARVYELIRSQN